MCEQQAIVLDQQKIQLLAKRCKLCCTDAVPLNGYISIKIYACI